MLSGMGRSDVVALNGPAHARPEEAKTDRTEALMRQITGEDGNKGESQHTKSQYVVE